VPTTAWDMDQFGLSATLPYLYKRAGLDNMLVLRVHIAMKEFLGRARMSVFNWRQFWDADGADDMLCHVEPYPYCNIHEGCGPNKAVCATLDFHTMPELPADST
jgi:hypothetical protein